MKYTTTRISVLLPVSNNEATLSECLESLLSQTHLDIEIIAIDDNSKDSSYKILRQYRKHDKRITVSRNVKKYGYAITLNRALKRTKGRYIAFMNPHDVATPDRFKRQLSYLTRHPKVVAVGTQVIFMNERKQKYDKSQFPTDAALISKKLFTEDCLQLESMLIDRYLLPKDLLRFENQDYPLVYRSFVMKLMPYGHLANLNQQLYVRFRPQHTQLEELSNQALSHVKLWLKARFVYDSAPSLTSLLYPLNNKIKSSL